MTQNSIGVAVVGTGFGQKIHIPGLQAHHRTEVVAVYHRDRNRAEAIAQAHTIPHACATIEEIVALPAVDAVAMSTPPFLHRQMATTVLQAGKHLLLEKPTALSTTEALAIQSLAEQYQRVVVMDFEFRFVPAWQHLADLLASGYVGRKRLIRIDWLVAGRADPTRPWSWYAQAAQGGGVLGAVGSHVFDYIAWLFGPVKRLCAQMNTAIVTRPDPQTGEPKPVDADDICGILLELVDGTPCHISLSAATYASRGHWVEVYGDQGTLVLGSDHPSDYVHGFSLRGSQGGQPLAEIPIPEALAFPKVYPDGRLAPFIRVVNHWVDCIDQGRNVPPAIAEGVYSQQIMDRVHESWRSQRWLDI